MVLKQAEQIRIRTQLPTVFSPAAPIDRKELFAGRIDQVVQVIGAVSQVGQHVVLFGERGVGKTSLASLIHEFWNDVFKDVDTLVSPRINCDTADTFETLWAKVAEEIQLIYEKRGLTVPSNGGMLESAFIELLQGKATPNIIRRFLDLAGKKFVIIADEFDRVQDEAASRLIADTIKTLSDHLVPATLVLVGVADTVEDLVEEHASIDRALVQVLMPRMSIEELEEIVRKGVDSVGMSIRDDACHAIAKLSQGLPHYAHLLGLYSALETIQSGQLEVKRDDVETAMKIAVERAQESIRNTYHQATMSPRRENLYKQVLLACAIAPVDDLGYFAPVDVREPMSRIMGRRYEIPAFVRHLNALCDEDKGCVLQKIGTERKQRFRFINPLIKPYIVLRGLEERMIDKNIVYPDDQLSLF